MEHESRAPDLPLTFYPEGETPLERMRALLASDRPRRSRHVAAAAGHKTPHPQQRRASGPIAGRILFGL